MPDVAIAAPPAATPAPSSPPSSTTSPAIDSPPSSGLLRLKRQSRRPLARPKFPKRRYRLTIQRRRTGLMSLSRLNSPGIANIPTKPRQKPRRRSRPNRKHSPRSSHNPISRTSLRRLPLRLSLPSKPRPRNSRRYLIASQHSKGSSTRWPARMLGWRQWESCFRQLLLRSCPRDRRQHGCNQGGIPAGCRRSEQDQRCF